MNKQEMKRKQDDIPKITFEQAITQLTLSWNTRNPMLLVGPPATAKTAVAKHFAAINGFDVLVTTGATDQPVDIKGMPAIYQEEDKPKADFVPFGTLRAAMTATKPTLWILDDFTNSDKDVQKSFMQLLHERQVGEHKLSNMVHIIATGNRREDKSGVSALIEAVKTRFGKVFEILPDVDSYLSSYAIPNGIHADVIGFLRFQPDSLYVHNPTNDMTREPNLRMWQFLSDELAELDDMQADRQTIELSVKGICGVSLANNVMAFIDLKSELPDIDDCLANPETCRLPDDSNISVIFAFNSVLARKASATNIHRVIAIADRLPKIYGAKLVYDAIAYCPDAADTSAYLSWSGRNRTTFIDS